MELYKRAIYSILYFFSSRRRHTIFDCDWSSDVCSSDLCSSPATRKSRRRSRKRSWPRWRASPRPALVHARPDTEELRHGEGEVRADEAARERGDDRAHRPRQDDADGGDHRSEEHTSELQSQ